MLKEIAVSNVHAIIFEHDGHHYIRDLGSRTGTFVNGEQIHQQSLKFDDQIRIGDHQMRFTQAAVSADADIDELEHLVGTATLGSEQMTLAKADAARVAAQAHAAPREETIPLVEPDDLIPIEPEIPVVEEAPIAAPVPAATGDLTEIDLNADPDVSGPGDTRAMPLESPSDTPRMPILSSQVVDDPAVAEEVGVEREERRLLVGADLHEDKVGRIRSLCQRRWHDDDDENADADIDLMAFALDTPVDAAITPVEEPTVSAEEVAAEHVATISLNPGPADAPPTSHAAESSPLPDHATVSTQETAELPAELSIEELAIRLSAR